MFLLEFWRPLGTILGKHRCNKIQREITLFFLCNQSPYLACALPTGLCAPCHLCLTQPRTLHTHIHPLRVSPQSLAVERRSEHGGMEER